MCNQLNVNDIALTIAPLIQCPVSLQPQPTARIAVGQLQCTRTIADLDKGNALGEIVLLSLLCQELLGLQREDDLKRTQKLNDAADILPM